MKEQLRFLTQKIYGPSTEKSAVVLHKQQVMEEFANDQLFDEAEVCQDKSVVEPSLYEAPKTKKQRPPSTRNLPQPPHGRQGIPPPLQ